jgi:3-oxoacyl-[acyl-carrier protein] reductase
LADSLTDRIAVVTGGSRGIGNAIVRRLAAEGARVAFTWVRDEQAALALQAACPGTRALRCDGRDRDAVDAAMADVLAAEGRVDILVNNAGVSVSSLFAMTPPEDWERVMAANVQGTYHWCRAAVRPMLARRSGAILNVASVSGLAGLAGQTAYGASKGAVLAFTRALAAELGPRGIRVNCLVPGFVETDMTAVIPTPMRRQYAERIALRRFGLADEAAAAALFLVSDQAAYITGQALVVDGGLSSALS